MNTTKPKRKRPPTTRRAGQYAITRITGHKEPGEHDAVTILELLDEFYGLPLTLDDIRAELGWTRERIRAAVTITEERGLVTAEALEPNTPVLVRRIEEEALKAWSR